VLSRLGGVGLIPAICTGQEGRRPARWHTELCEQRDIGGPAPAGV